MRMRAASAMVLIALSISLTPSVGQAVTGCNLPGNRPSHVVAIGAIRNFTPVATVNDTPNWVALAFYSFTCPTGTGTAGTVTRSYWSWNQGLCDRGTSQCPKHTNVAVTTVPPDTQSCNISVPTGFSSTGYVNQSGSFTVPRDVLNPTPTSDILNITWSNGTTERWDVSIQAQLAAMRLRTASYPGQAPNYGVGFGSASTFGSWKRLRDLPSGTLTHWSMQNNAGANWHDSGVKSHNSINPSPANPATYRFQTTGNNLLFKSQYDYPGIVYIAGEFLPSHLGRANSWESDTKSLTSGGCAQNGHLKPMLQIIDDAGAFRGWVGVEASLDHAGCGGSKISVFRYTDSGVSAFDPTVQGPLYSGSNCNVQV